MALVFRVPFLLLVLTLIALFTRSGVWAATLALGVTFLGYRVFMSAEKEAPFHGLLITALVMVLVLSLGFNVGAEPLKQGYTRILDAISAIFPGLKKTRIIDAVYSFWVYLEYLPGILVFVLWTGISSAISQESYPVTGWYRWSRDFDHRWVYPALACLLAGFVVYQMGLWDKLGLVASNLTLFLALVYSVLGFQVLITWLRKKRWPVMLSVALLYCLLVLTGPYFLFVLVLYFGIGISDSWMHYLRA